MKSETSSVKGLMERAAGQAQNTIIKGAHEDDELIRRIGRTGCTSVCAKIMGGGRRGNGQGVEREEEGEGGIWGQ